MGGFLLFKKNQKVPVEELEKRNQGSINVFKKKGLQLRKKVVREDFVIFAFHKYSFKTQDQFEFENGDFIISTGTSMYNGNTGASALRALHKDFSSQKEFHANLFGSYCMLIFLKGKLYIFNDYTGLYRIYCNKTKTVLSSSFLAVAKTLSERNISKQEFYEYLFHEAFYGDSTILKEIDLLDSTQLWQISPEISKTPQKVSAGNFRNDRSFDEIVTMVSRGQIEYFQMLKNAFKSKIISSLSGGYDSRLMLALMRKVGIVPSLFVYGEDDSRDVKIAKTIAQGEKLQLDHTDKSKFAKVEPDKFYEIVEGNYFLFDGLGCTGVFDNGSDIATRIIRANKANLHLNGGGGEIYRSVWQIPKEKIDIGKFLENKYGPIHILEDFVDYSICSDFFDKKEYFSKLRGKIKAILDIEQDWLTMQQVVLLYPFLRHKYWMGMNHSIDNQFSHALTPYAESRFIFESFHIPMKYKYFGQFEAALIRKIDPHLARYPSAYGFNFYDPVKWQTKITTALRKNLPFFLRSVIPVIHRELRAKNYRPPFYFNREYLKEIFDDLDLHIYRYINLEKIKDPIMLSRVLSVELLLEDKF